MVQDVEFTTAPKSCEIPTTTLGTILVIEDDPRMQKVLRRIFTGERYAAVVAGQALSD